MAITLAIDDNLIYEAKAIEGCTTKKATECSHICRSTGILGSHIDFLICVPAEKDNAQIFIPDYDRFTYKNHIICE